MKVMIEKGGFGGELVEKKMQMYDDLKVFFQRIDNIPEPHKTVSLTTVRSVLRYVETLQDAINTLNNNM